MPSPLLIVTETYLVGGLETHIKTQVDALVSHNTPVHLITGKKFSEDLLPDGLTSVENSLICNPSMVFDDLWEDVCTIRKIIRKNRIKCVHAHPFISLISAFIAAQLERVAFVVTLHGPSSIQVNCYGYLYSFLLKYVILPNCHVIFVVSDEIAKLTTPFCTPSKIVIQYNSIDMSTEVQRLEEKAINGWLLCSRLDEDKVSGIKKFINYAISSGIKHIAILGDGSESEKLKEYLIDNNQAEYVFFLGTKVNVRDEMKHYSGIAGMGRAALEGLSLGLPVILVGYDGVKGLITENNFKELLKYNFSGRGYETISHDTFDKQISELVLYNDDRVKIINLINKLCCIENNITNYLDIIYSKHPPLQSALEQAFDVYQYINKTKDPIPFLYDLDFFVLLGEFLYPHANNQLALIYNNYSSSLFLDKINKEVQLVQIDNNELRQKIFTYENEIQELNHKLSIISKTLLRLTYPFRIIINCIRSVLKKIEAK